MIIAELKKLIAELPDCAPVVVDHYIDGLIDDRKIVIVVGQTDTFSTYSKNYKAEELPTENTKLIPCLTILILDYDDRVDERGDDSEPIPWDVISRHSR